MQAKGYAAFVAAASRSVCGFMRQACDDGPAFRRTGQKLKFENFGARVLYGCKGGGRRGPGGGVRSAGLPAAAARRARDRPSAAMPIAQARMQGVGVGGRHAGKAAPVA